MSVHPSETFATCILKSVMQDSSTLSIFTWIIFLSGMFVLMLCIFTDVTLIKMPTDYVCPIMCWTYMLKVWVVSGLPFQQLMTVNCDDQNCLKFILNLRNNIFPTLSFCRANRDGPGESNSCDDWKLSETETEIHLNLNRDRNPLESNVTQDQDIAWSTNCLPS